MTNIKNSVFKEILRDYLSEIDAEIKALEKLRDDYARIGKIGFLSEVPIETELALYKGRCRDLDKIGEGLIDPITELFWKVGTLKRIVS